MKQNRFLSPVVWAAVFGVVLAQLTSLSQKGDVTGWDIAIATVTVILAFFGEINDPTNKTGM